MDIENPDLAMFVFAFVFAPLILLAVVGMFKHYHLWIHIYRSDKQHHEDGE